MNSKLKFFNFKKKYINFIKNKIKNIQKYICNFRVAFLLQIKTHMYIYTKKLLVPYTNEIKLY